MSIYTTVWKDYPLIRQAAIHIIPESSDKDHDKIDKPTNTAKAEGKKPKDTRSGFMYIKTMNAKIAKKQAQEERYPFLFGNIGKSVRVVVYVGVCVCVYDVDGRLLCSLWRFSRLPFWLGFWQQRRNANGGSVVYRAFDRLRGVFDKPNALFAVSYH